MSGETKTSRAWAGSVVTLVLLALAVPARAAGLRSSSNGELRILNHHVNVVINNGFAQTEVIQTFANPSGGAAEATYAFPIPKDASLSEMTITTGEKTIQGEVMPRAEAQSAYEEERDRGRQAGLATKEESRRFEFRVSPIVPGENVIVRFVYYQPLPIDTGVGRYLYPLESGETDAKSGGFWGQNQQVDGVFSLHLLVKSAWPVSDFRVPGFESAATISRVSDYEATVELSQAGAVLNRDFVFYYRLADDLPGRVEVVASRERKGEPGTFMLVVTPGVDLQPIREGADFIYVLDVSGSMQSKIATVRAAVKKSVSELESPDRFRIVTFETNSRELTDGWQTATVENKARYGMAIDELVARGNTNLYAGFEKALVGMENSRPTSLILITDAVANTGVVSPGLIRQMVRRYDVRVFGFLMGNEANWPLMRLVAESTGGFYTQVSNSDDILGQLTLAKGKIKFEALRDVRIEIEGGDTFDLTDVPRKLFRGQQLVVFGRYRTPGAALVKIHVRFSTSESAYEAKVTFPEGDAANPEVERLWAMSRIDKLELLESTGQLDSREAAAAIRELGVGYQLVTDHTSMVVLSDDAFAERRIERKNQERVARESQAQTRRVAEPSHDTSGDQDRSTFRFHAPSLGGGGALNGRDLLVMVAALALIVGFSRRRQA